MIKILCFFLLPLAAPCLLLAGCSIVFLFLLRNNCLSLQLLLTPINRLSLWASIDLQFGSLTLNQNNSHNCYALVTVVLVSIYVVRPQFSSSTPGNPRFVPPNWILPDSPYDFLASTAFFGVPLFDEDFRRIRSRVSDVFV